MRLVLCLSQLLFVFSSLGKAESRTISPESSSADLDAILSGIKTYVQSRSLGFVFATTPAAFPIIAAKQGDGSRAPIIVGSKYGKGRMIVGTHDGIIEVIAPDQPGDNNQFLLNSIRWLASSRDKPIAGGPTPTVALFDIPNGASVIPFLEKNSLKPTTISKQDILSVDKLSNVYDVILIGKSGAFYQDLPTIQKILSFVENGGSIFLTTTSWAWSVDDLKLANRLISPAGIILLTGSYYAQSTVDGAANTYDASPSQLKDTHIGEVAGKIVSAIHGSNTDLQVAELAEHTNKLERLLTTLPGDDDPFMVSFKKNVKTCNLKSVIPTKQKKVKTLKEKATLLINYIWNTIILKPEEIEADPSADIFPGKVLGSSAESRMVQEHQVGLNIRAGFSNGKVSGNVWDSCGFDSPHFEKSMPISDDDVQIQAKLMDWYSTGLYAPAGQLITITFNYAKNLDAFQIRIGGHKDDLRSLEEWARPPRITIQKEIPKDGSPMKIANPFGGLIYLVVVENVTGDPIKLSISGAVKAPYFVLGKTTNEEWKSTLQNYNGPWAEFENENIILTVPTTVARTVSDPQGLMEYWNDVINGFSKLMDVDRSNMRPERFYADVQISAGYMHSGYPIMSPLGEAATTTNVAKMKTDAWGQYHEVGHNYEESPWKWADRTNNLMVLYIYEKIVKVSYETVRDNVWLSTRKQEAKDYIKNGKKYDYYTSQFWLPLSTYIQLQKKFGWEFYEGLFKSYHKLSKDEVKNLDMDAKTNLWAVMTSKQSGENLFPFYRSWGFPLKEESEEKVKGLPLTQLRIEDIFNE